MKSTLISSLYGVTLRIPDVFSSASECVASQPLACVESKKPLPTETPREESEAPTIVAQTPKLKSKAKPKRSRKIALKIPQSV